MDDDEQPPPLFAEVAPYLANPSEMAEIIEKCSGTPSMEECLLKYLDKSEGTLKVDIKITLDRLNRVGN